MRVSSYTTVSVRSALVRSCKWHWEVWHRLEAVKQKLGILPKNQLQPPVSHQFSKNPQDFPKLSSKNQDIPIIHSNHVPIYHIPPGHFPTIFPSFSQGFPPFFPSVFSAQKVKSRPAFARHRKALRTSGSLASGRRPSTWSGRGG